MQLKQKICAGLAVLLLFGQGGTALAAEAAPGETGETEESSSAVPVYAETLQDRRIGAGELVSYTTVSSEFAGMPAIEGIYPGELTVTIAGTVVIEAGGCLSIGTLSVGGGEASPVLRWEPGARIVVEGGGRLELTGVLLQGGADTPVIVQESGGSVALQATPVEEGLISWSGPVVNNLSVRPDDLWLEEGTPLTAELLPAVIEAELETQGIARWTELSVCWDLDGCTDRTEGEVTVSGQFLDETGTVLPGLCPLELTVHWYAPEELVVTDAVWKGSAVPSVQLTVPWLPEDADLYGEVSTDDGQTWQRWEDPEDFFVVPEEAGGYVCVFALPDDTPRMFRLVAQAPWEHRYWKSQAFALAPGETDDSGGNRGGSTTPGTPEREPALPSPTPVTTEEPAAEPTPAPALASVPAVAAAPAPAAVSEQPSLQPTPDTASATAEQAQSPTPVPDSGAVLTPETAAPASTATPAEPQTAEKLPLPVQVLLVAAGLAVCAVLALAVTRTGPFRRKP